MTTKRTTAKKTVVSETKESKKSTLADTLIYVGPTLPGGALTKFTIYTNGVPGHMKKDYEENTFFKNLFVPVSKFAEAEKDLSDPNSALSVFTQKTINHFSRKG